MVIAGVGPGDWRLVAQVKGRCVLGTGRRAAVLVHSALHLLQDLVDLLQVSLGAQVGHGRQIVVLVKGAGCRRTASDGREGRCSGHVLGAKSSRVDGKGAVKWHQRPPDVGVVAWVKTPPLGMSKEIVEIIVTTTSAVIRSIVAQGLSTVVGNGLLVVSHMAIGLGSAMAIVAMRRRLAIGGGVGTHLMAIVIIKTRWAFDGATIGGAHGAMLVLW